MNCRFDSLVGYEINQVSCNQYLKKKKKKEFSTIRKVILSCVCLSEYLSQHKINSSHFLGTWYVPHRDGFISKQTKTCPLLSPAQDLLEYKAKQAEFSCSEFRSGVSARGKYRRGAENLPKLCNRSCIE